VNTEHSEPVASIQIYFEGRAKFFPHSEGTNGPKPETGRVESGGGVLWRGLAAPPPARGLGERCKLPQRGPGHFGATLRPQNLLQKCHNV